MWVWGATAVVCVLTGIAVGYRMAKADQRWWAEFWRNR